ncbi:MAG TPA: hypothetical protein V6D27_00935 [Vampirovibrionales bacterium]
MPSNLSQEVAISAFAKQIQVSIPRILSYLKESGKISREATAEGLLLDPATQAAISAHFGSKGFAPTPVTAPTRPEISITPAPESEALVGVKSIPEMAIALEISPAEVGQLINIAGPAYGVHYPGYIDADWEVMIQTARANLCPELGGTGKLTSAEFTTQIRAKIVKAQGRIQEIGKAAIATELDRAIDETGSYLGTVSNISHLEHATALEAWTDREAENLEVLYDADNLQCRTLQKLAYRLADRRSALQGHQASLPTTWQARLGKLGQIAGRTVDLAIAPIAGDAHTAASIIGALAESSRP